MGPSAVLVTLAVVLLVRPAAADINCYQCSSTDHEDPYLCPETFNDEGDPDGYLPPAQSCSQVHGASYCIKQTGRFEGGLGTKRFCSALDLGNYCNYVRQPGDDKEYRSCVFTCSSDGCNPGARTLPLAPLLLLPILPLVWRP
ncbi:U-scoloptoxin(05)-Cw1a [Neocloeon triangulifer]|uniref:U-scoloptoxin(05)-Cw1a n=1 Tax=Neocloeon triangulifer TaxID=2078957 RepID=UPI00286F72D4|nr:U-scoloptoxin(05)-Cw1a [Neocloeon triangulifer]